MNGANPESHSLQSELHTKFGGSFWTTFLRADTPAVSREQLDQTKPEFSRIGESIVIKNPQWPVFPPLGLSAEGDLPLVSGKRRMSGLDKC